MIPDFDFIGSYGALGGEVRILEVDALDFSRAETAILELAGYIENTLPPLTVSRQIAAEDMRQRFETETAPDGKRWAALDPDYAERKKHDVGFEHPILQRHRLLKTSATKTSRFVITGDSLFYNTAGLPEYWHIHQEGSEDFGAVFHSSFVEETGHLESSAGTGAQNIPPRPFIGLSAEAEAKIFDEFDIWFAHGIEETTRRFVVSGSGVLQFRVAGGRFGPRVPL